SAAGIASTVNLPGITAPTLGSNLSGVFCWVFSVSSASWIALCCWSLSCNGALCASDVRLFGSMVVLSCASAGIEIKASAVAALHIRVFMTVLRFTRDNGRNAGLFRAGPAPEVTNTGQKSRDGAPRGEQAVAKGANRARGRSKLGRPGMLGG